MFRPVFFELLGKKKENKDSGSWSYGDGPPVLHTGMCRPKDKSTKEHMVDALAPRGEEGRAKRR